MTSNASIDAFWQALQQDARINNGAREIVSGIANNIYIIEPVMRDGQVYGYCAVFSPAYRETLIHIQRWIQRTTREQRPGNQPRRKRAWRML